MEYCACCGSQLNKPQMKKQKNSFSYATCSDNRWGIACCSCGNSWHTSRDPAEYAAECPTCGENSGTSDSQDNRGLFIGKVYN